MPFRFGQLLISSLIVCFSLIAHAQEGDQALTVDATAPLVTISPYVLGANYGPWALVSMDMQEEAANSGVTYFRFPGGRWGDEQNLTHQQVDLFMLQANAWNAIPGISLRLEDGTPEQAAELVHYMNIEKGYGVRYWSIGNEPDLFVDYPVERLNSEWRAIALAIRAVDPTLLLIGPEVSQFPPTIEGDAYTNARREMVRSFLEANGDLVDIVSIHRYPFPTTLNSPVTTAQDLYQNTPEWDILVENLRQVIIETVGHELPMAITELNSHWNHVSGGEGTPDSSYHAIWWGDVLGRLIRGRVAIVNYFTLFSSGTLGAFGLLDRYEVRPTYYVYQLYRQLGDQLLASTSPDDDVTITAALRADGALTLIVINRALESDKTLPVIIAGWADAVGGDAEVWRLDPTVNAEQVGMVAFTSADDHLSGTLELPAQSITLIVLPAS